MIGRPECVHRQRAKDLVLHSALDADAFTFALECVRDTRIARVRHGMLGERHRVWLGRKGKGRGVPAGRDGLVLGGVALTAPRRSDVRSRLVIEREILAIRTASLAACAAFFQSFSWRKQRLRSHDASGSVSVLESDRRNCLAWAGWLIRSSERTRSFRNGAAEAGAAALPVGSSSNARRRALAAPEGSLSVDRKIPSMSWPRASHPGCSARRTAVSSAAAWKSFRK